MSDDLAQLRRQVDEANKRADYYKNNAEREAGYNAGQHAKCVGYVGELQDRIRALEAECTRLSPKDPK